MRALASRFTAHMSADTRVPTIEAALAPDAPLRRSRAVDGAFTWVAPQKPEGKGESRYELVGFSRSALKELQLEPNDELVQIIAGEKVVIDLDQRIYPYAQAYAGHQFGSWAGQLGDGRVVSLFELQGLHNRYELQLKGAGLTPYSRFADGRAVVRSSVREMLGAEFTHALGIPTTRALGLVKLNQTEVRRERMETGAVVARFAPSWVRVGTFDFHRARSRSELRRLCDFVCTLFNERKEEAQANDISKSVHPYRRLYNEIVRLNAQAVAHWQAYGLMNGVLNTDNTSVLGLALDYGPFAYMDTFDRRFTPNHDDDTLRYCYLNQPEIIWWNMVRLGEDLGELLGAHVQMLDDPVFVEKGVTQKQADVIIEQATAVIDQAAQDFETVFEHTYNTLMAKRLGLTDTHADLVNRLLDLMEEAGLGFNRVFRVLSTDPSNLVDMVPAESQSSIKSWLSDYKALQPDQKAMLKVNPNFVLSTYNMNRVIEAVDRGHYELFREVMEMALDPFADDWSVSEEAKKLADEPAKYERNLQCSCSS